MNSRLQFAGVRPLDALPLPGVIHSALRFVLVGALGTLLDLSLFVLLSVRFGFPALLANTLSYSAGIVSSYFFHRHWTFAHRSPAPAGGQFAKFASVSLSALGINNLVVLLLTPQIVVLIGDHTFGAVGAKLCALGIGVCWNFLANYLWTFRVAAH